MNTKKNTQWFVRVRGNFANEVLAGMLEGHCAGWYIDESGKRLRLWMCEFEDIEQLKRNSFGIKFTVYTRDGNEGKVKVHRAPEFAQMRRRHPRKHPQSSQTARRPA